MHQNAGNCIAIFTTFLLGGPSEHQIIVGPPNGFHSHPVYHIYFYATQDKTMAIYFMSKCPNKCTQLRQQFQRVARCNGTSSRK